jgi:co-chaperonin GroES (HSP10)
MSEILLPEGALELLGEPMLNQVLVKPRSAEKYSPGGIALSAGVQQNTQYLTYVGQVLKLGPYAFKRDEFMGMTAIPGDWVVYGHYSGIRQEIELGGKRFTVVLMSDKDIKLKVADPSIYCIYT